MTTLYTTLSFCTDLHNYAQLYKKKKSKHFTHFHTTLHTFTKLNKTLQNLTKLYKTKQTFTKPDKTCQNQTKLYKAFLCCIQLFKTLQTFFLQNFQTWYLHDQTQLFYTTKHNFFVVHNFTNLYMSQTTLQDFATKKQLYKTLHNLITKPYTKMFKALPKYRIFCQLYKTLENFQHFTRRLPYLTNFTKHTKSYTIQNSTQLYNTSHNITQTKTLTLQKMYTTIQHSKQLYNIVQHFFCTILHKSSHNFTTLFKTKTTCTNLYKTLHSSTKPTKFFKTLQNST